VIALDLAKELLELHPNSNVLVVSHENISNAFYTGKDPSMLLINVLFRANGAAVIMTNKPKYAGRQYQGGGWLCAVLLISVVLSQRGSSHYHHKPKHAGHYLGVGCIGERHRFGGRQQGPIYHMNQIVV
jgi:hypothetical protein